MHEFPVAKKFGEEGGGEFQDSPLKIFCLTVPKAFVGEPITVALISCVEKVWIRGKEYQEFTSKFFCLAVPKDYVGESFIFSKISVT